MLSGTRVQIGDEKSDFKDNIQNPIPNKSPNLKDLNDADLATFDVVLKTFH